MHFKLIIALTEDSKIQKIIGAARQAGATGSTVLKQASGDGLQESKTFLGLKLEIQKDMLMFLVEEHLARDILEAIAEAGDFENPNTGMAFQIDVEDVIGIKRQISKLTHSVEDEI
jgi:nitrogen regulatory protein PII